MCPVLSLCWSWGMVLSLPPSLHQLSSTFHTQLLFFTHGLWGFDNEDLSNSKKQKQFPVKKIWSESYRWKSLWGKVCVWNFKIFVTLFILKFVTPFVHKMGVVQVQPSISYWKFFFIFLVKYFYTILVTLFECSFSFNDKIFL